MDESDFRNFIKGYKRQFETRFCLATIDMYNSENASDDTVQCFEPRADFDTQVSEFLKPYTMLVHLVVPLVGGFEACYTTYRKICKCLKMSSLQLSQQTMLHYIDSLA